jgi:hypothetical protein
MGIEEQLAKLFADVLEDIIVQTLGDSAAKRLKSIFSPDKRKRKRVLTQAFKSAIENTHEISPELKEVLSNRDFAENLLKYVLMGDLDRIAENTEALKTYLVGEDPEKVLNDYFESIEKRYGYLDLKGFSPRIGRKEIVKIPLDNIFIPLKFVEEAKIDYSETRDGETGFGKSGAKIIGMDDLLGYDRCVILGDPGSGKTTLLKRFAYEKRSYIPIYVRIADYSEKMSQFSDLYSFVVNSDSKYKNLFKWAIENGKALILLDGLDEVIDAAHRIKVSEEIRKLLTSFLNNKYVVTSRLIGYESARLAGFDHFIIQPFEREDIELFARRWYRAIADESDKEFKEAEKNANELIEAIFRNKSIERLATNPMLMTIIALIHYRGKKLPNKRVELYQVCAETMLDSWILQRIPREDYLKDKDALIEILSPVAFDIHATSQRGLIDEDTFREKMMDVMVSEQGIDMRSAKKEAKEIKKYLEEESGLFLEKGKEEGKALYGFFHLSFQEYFAALELVAKWKKGQIDLKDYVFDSRWIEIVRLGAAELGSAAKRGRYEATEFVKAILNVEDDFEEARRSLILAGYILSDDVKLEPGVENKIIDDLFYEYLNTDYEELEDLIGNVIEELLSSEKEKLISERLKELAKNENVRAVALLRLIEVEEALSILSNLANSKSVAVRRSVASNMVDLSRSSRATKKFVKILNNLIENEDFITFFSIAQAFEKLSTKNIKFPDKLRESRNFRKYSLFSPPSKLSLLGLNELVRDNDREISKIATLIDKIEKGGKSMKIQISEWYPIAIYPSKSALFIFSVKNDSELVYFEFKNIEDVMTSIGAIISDLPVTRDLIFQFVFSLILRHPIAKDMSVMETFEKIVSDFKNDLSTSILKARSLRFSLSNVKLTADNFPKTDSPVISSLISYILNEKPDEGIIKGCIEIFRKEKSAKNKRALFNLLHHFLNPFVR